MPTAKECKERGKVLNKATGRCRNPPQKKKSSPKKKRSPSKSGSGSKGVDRSSKCFSKTGVAKCKGKQFCDVTNGRCYKQAKNGEPYSKKKMEEKYGEDLYIDYNARVFGPRAEVRQVLKKRNPNYLTVPVTAEMSKTEAAAHLAHKHSFARCVDSEGNNICPDGKYCDLYTGDCRRVKNDGGLWGENTFRKAKGREDMVLDKEHRIFGPRAEMEQLARELSRRLGADAGAVHAALKDVSDKCFDKNGKMCPEGTVCHAISGKCIAANEITTASNPILVTDDGRVITGPMSRLQELQKTLGGQISGAEAARAAMTRPDVSVRNPRAAIEKMYGQVAPPAQQNAWSGSAGVRTVRQPMRADTQGGVADVPAPQPQMAPPSAQRVATSRAGNVTRVLRAAQAAAAPDTRTGATWSETQAPVRTQVAPAQDAWSGSAGERTVRQPMRAETEGVPDAPPPARSVQFDASAKNEDGNKRKLRMTTRRPVQQRSEPVPVAANREEVIQTFNNCLQNMRNE